jgi:hypothetical protein
MTDSRHLSDHPAVRKAGVVLLAQLAMQMLSEPDTTTRTRNAIRATSRSPKDQENIIQAALAMHGAEALLSSPQLFAEALSQAFVLLMLPPSPPSLGDLLGALTAMQALGIPDTSTLAEARAALEAMLPAPEPEEGGE